MTRVHAVDWRKPPGSTISTRQHHGALGPEQRHNYLDHYRRWTHEGEPHPIIDPAWKWLDANWPDDGEHVELCWGDARPGNQMFDGTEVVGVFDWEMVSLGNGESDLGWWIFLQRYPHRRHRRRAPGGHARPRRDHRGVGAAARTRRPTNVDFYERLGGFQFCLVMVRLAESMGVPEMATDNPVAHLTAELIESS